MDTNTDCQNCHRPITAMCFKGGDWCSDDCRKELQGETNG